MPDRDELEKLYRANYRTVWNICLTFLRNASDVEDAVQDTFIRLAQSKKRFHDDDGAKAWLIAVAKNVCRDELRKKRRSDLPLEEERCGAAAMSEPDETLEAVRSLSEKYRIPIYLFYYEGLSTAQIARLTGRREPTVRSDLSRGRNELRRILERSK
ncbi:MAG: sigma-70 family RNA polymerase sigma factor [Clostridia bacterium]|nr:sigma-70 family RNA polymerase sigma factor [Clostridia bacterium]MBR5769507.1 sigma-70 family RNA polymerase sigma factor [Clostridia bacterium]